MTALHVAPSRRMGIGPYQTFRTHREPPPPRPDTRRRCVVCDAFLANDQKRDRCSCHDYVEGEFDSVPRSFIVLAESDPNDDVTIDTLARMLRLGVGELVPEQRSERDALWVNEYEQGLTPTEIAKKYAVPRSTVRTVLRKAGAYTEEMGRPRWQREDLPRIYERDAQMLEFWEQGTSTHADIAERFGVSKTLVNSALIRARKRRG